MQKKNQSLAGGPATRRNFLKKSAVVAAAAVAANPFKTPVYGQSSAPSTGKVIGANDRIAVAVVGVGYGIGMNHFIGIQDKSGQNNTIVAAGCDLAEHRRGWMRGELELYKRKVPQALKKEDTYSDYRKLLERKDIDAVVVATHDVWHTKISCDAMEAGKHVYCEKPMTRYLEEAYQMYDTVKRTKAVFTVGSQGCSAAGWHKTAEIIKSGKIGPMVWAQGYYCRNNPKGEWNYPIDPQTTPEGLDWKTWLGPVKDRAFSADAFHRWRKYYPYCGGLLGDLVPHRLHPLMLATGNPEYPKRVMSIGTKHVHTDKKTPGTPERDVPEHVQIVAEFPSGLMLTVSSSTVNAKSPGFVIYGHHATMEIGSSGEKIRLIPEKDFTDEVDEMDIGGLQPEDIRVHEKNWFDCIRTGAMPNANIELATRVQVVISLAEMSERLGVACHYDEKNRKVRDGAGKEIKPITYGSLQPA